MEGKINPQNNPLIDANTKLKCAKLSILVFFSFLLVFFGGLWAQSAQAASLYLSPASGSYNLGQAFSVNVYVSSADQAMNAASGAVLFPADKLQVTSLVKTGSIINLWVQEPSFSNPPAGGQGTVNFEGIIYNPGYTGSKGKIITINFKVKGGGEASLNLSLAAVLANDGQGTNILTGLGGADFALEVPSIGPAAPKATTPTVLPGVPAAPQISSQTHPDSNQWYAKKDAVLSWPLPPDTLSTRLLLSHIPQANPLVVYTPAVNSKEFKDLDDGTWYLHVQLRNSSGWGSVSHFQLQIDTVPPESLSIKFAEGKETDNPRPTVYFNTTDSLSGIDNYKIKIGEGDEFILPTVTVQSNSYTLPLQAPGKRSILVQAFDKAGNFATAAEEFVIKPIQSPTFTSYPQQIYTDEVFEAKGTTYPNSQITVWLQREDDKPKSQIVKSDEKGNFNFVADKKLKDGVYKLWAEVTDERGAKSNPSETIIFKVTLSLQIQIGKFVIDYISIINLLLIIVIGLVATTFYIWYKLKLWRRRVKKETLDAEKKLRRAFSALSQEVKKQVSKLDGYEGLSEREKIIYERLKKALETSEKFVGKEIKDIERELKK